MKFLIKRSLRPNKFIPVWLFISILIPILLYSCMASPPQGSNVKDARVSFNSNGERIYLTASSDRGTSITTATGVSSSRGMMGNDTERGNRGNGFLTCASCHFSDGHGGEHTMMGMQTMKSADIRWSSLKDEFDSDEKFRLAITQGQDPDGKKILNRDMPRYQIGNEDLADLIAYLKTL